MMASSSTVDDISHGIPGTTHAETTESVVGENIAVKNVPLKRRGRGFADTSSTSHLLRGYTPESSSKVRVDNERVVKDNPPVSFSIDAMNDTAMPPNSRRSRVRRRSHSRSVDRIARVPLCDSEREMDSTRVEVNVESSENRKRHMDDKYEGKRRIPDNSDDDRRPSRERVKLSPERNRAKQDVSMHERLDSKQHARRHSRSPSESRVYRAKDSGRLQSGPFRDDRKPNEYRERHRNRDHRVEEKQRYRSRSRSRSPSIDHRNPSPRRRSRSRSIDHRDPSPRRRSRSRSHSSEEGKPGRRIRRSVPSPRQLNKGKEENPRRNRDWDMYVTADNNNKIASNTTDVKSEKVGNIGLDGNETIDNTNGKEHNEIMDDTGNAGQPSSTRGQYKPLWQTHSSKTVTASSNGISRANVPPKEELAQSAFTSSNAHDGAIALSNTRRTTMLTVGANTASVMTAEAVQTMRDRLLTPPSGVLGSNSNGTATTVAHATRTMAEGSVEERKVGKTLVNREGANAQEIHVGTVSSTQHMSNNADNTTVTATPAVSLLNSVASENSLPTPGDSSNGTTATAIPKKRRGARWTSVTEPTENALPSPIDASGDSMNVQKELTSYNMQAVSSTGTQNMAGTQRDTAATQQQQSQLQQEQLPHSSLVPTSIPGYFLEATCPPPNLTAHLHPLLGTSGGSLSTYPQPCGNGTVNVGATAAATAALVPPTGGMMAYLASINPSRILVLINALSDEDLRNAAELADIVNDIAIEVGAALATEGSMRAMMTLAPGTMLDAQQLAASTGRLLAIRVPLPASADEHVDPDMIRRGKLAMRIPRTGSGNHPIGLDGSSGTLAIEDARHEDRSQTVPRSAKEFFERVIKPDYGAATTTAGVMGLIKDVLPSQQQQQQQQQQQVTTASTSSALTLHGSAIDKQAASDTPEMDPLKGRTKGLGKVFLEFATPDAAITAQKELSGRAFNGRILITSFVTEEAYRSGDICDFNACWQSAKV